MWNQAKSHGGRRGFTLVELLVVIAIIGMLIALLIPAVQAARESARRTTCKNQLKQLALAVQNLHDTYQLMPCYFGAFPPDSKGSVVRNTTENLSKPAGSWLVHLLPYIEQQAMWDEIAEDAAANNQNWRNYTTPQSGCSATQNSNYNGGHTWDSTSCTDAGVYDDHGIYQPQVRTRSLANILCPSDPRAPNHGTGEGWGATSYLANYHALDSGVKSSSGANIVWNRPPSYAQITDGLTNTVLFAEAYTLCSGRGRLAMYSWRYHNFGLDWMPTPNTNTLMFQVQPSTDRCTTSDCCDPWRTQTPHAAMNIALCDGSVRQVNGSISNDAATQTGVWDRLMLPRDGLGLPSDW